MPDTPPPLPVAGPAQARALAQAPARMAPPAAPLLWRSLAFLVDATLFGLIGYLLLSRWLIPEYHPEALASANRFHDEYESFIRSTAERMADGHLSFEAAIRQLIAKAESAPEAVAELAEYTSSTMTLVFWIGFSLSEILTGGASLGKRIFRLRVASFPHAEKPGFFDCIVRNGWKAMAVGSTNPLIMLFAVVDAHWPLFNPLRRSLHDYLSRTLVLDARFDPPEPPKNDEDEERDDA